MAPTTDVGFNTLPTTEVQRYGALGGLIPRVLEGFPDPCGGSRGPIVLLKSFPQPYGAQRRDQVPRTASLFKYRCKFFAVPETSKMATAFEDHWNL